MPFTRRRILRIGAASCLPLAGCTGGSGGSGGGQSPTGTAGSGSGGPVVEMVDTSFDPVRVSVDTGTAVEWVNEDGVEHDVTAAKFHDSAADWDFSTALAAGERATHTFESAGVYEYYCTIHGEGTMCGAVLVGGAALDASLPCQDGSGGSGGSSGGYY